jgi:hypothetical protein
MVTVLIILALLALVSLAGLGYDALTHGRPSRLRKEEALRSQGVMRYYRDVGEMSGGGGGGA